MSRIVVLTALFVACHDQSLSGHTPEAVFDGEPAIKVAPRRIDFGELSYGETSAVPFTVESVGAKNSILEVAGIVIDSDHFVLTAPDDGTDDLDFILPYGAKREVMVTFSPDEPIDYSALVLVYSDDDNAPVVPVELLGRGVMPELRITPDPLNFGVVNKGCVVEEEIELTNVGNDDLVITAITEDERVMPIVATPSLPLTLSPGASDTLTLSFVPEAEESYVGILAVESNEPLAHREAVQRGEGLVPQDYVDSFSLVANPEADIAFFVDQSRSMDDDQEALAENIERFIEGLSPYTPDWQLMVVTRDDGCSETGVMTPGTMNYVERFSNAAMNGEWGDNTERGLEVVYNAALESGTGGCNEGFIRPSALLHFIMVSDEPEQSPRGWQYYVDHLSDMKGDDTLLKMSAVAGDVPGGCESDDNDASSGTGYWEAVQATGGTFLSLCSDWAENVAVLASASVSMSSFELSHEPDPFTIVVSVNGITVTGIWSYQSESNSVIFSEGYEPHDGDRIDIAYSEPTTCD